jgi:sortase A
MVVLEGSSGRNLAFGPTHDPVSVLPGEAGNSVIEGHRDTHFRVLKQLQVGDSIRVELPGGRQELFVVSRLQVADTRRVRISLESELPELTLVTCYPFEALQPGGPLRYVVSARRVATESSKPNQQRAFRRSELAVDGHVRCCLHSGSRLRSDLPSLRAPA